MATNPNDLSKTPMQQKTDILKEYHQKGGSILINSTATPHKRITVDSVEGSQVLYYIVGSGSVKIPISSIMEIKDHKTGEKLFPKE